VVIAPSGQEIAAAIRSKIGLCADALRRGLDQLGEGTLSDASLIYLDDQLFKAGEWITQARQLLCVQSAIHDGAIPSNRPVESGTGTLVMFRENADGPDGGNRP